MADRRGADQGRADAGSEILDHARNEFNTVRTAVRPLRVCWTRSDSTITVRRPASAARDDRGAEARSDSHYQSFDAGSIRTSRSRSWESDLGTERRRRRKYDRLRPASQRGAPHDLVRSYDGSRESPLSRWLEIRALLCEGTEGSLVTRRRRRRR